MKKNLFSVFLEKGKLFSNSQKAFSLAETKKIGEKNKGIVNYSAYEALYLVSMNLAEIVKTGRIVEKSNAEKTSSGLDKGLHLKYVVYEKLRKRGFVPKSALKFGCDFRVYEKNGIDKHARWLVIVVKESERLDLKELSARVRVSHSTAKKLLIAIVDSEESVSFYETDYIKI